MIASPGVESDIEEEVIDIDPIEDIREEVVLVPPKEPNLADLAHYRKPDPPPIPIVSQVPNPSPPKNTASEWFDLQPVDDRPSFKFPT